MPGELVALDSVWGARDLRLGPCLSLSLGPVSARSHPLPGDIGGGGGYMGVIWRNDVCAFP